MDCETLEAARLLIEFGREVVYNDSRFPPKDINEAAMVLEKYLDGE